MTDLQTTYTLNNGVKIPKVGLGFWQVEPGDQALQVGLEGLKDGYRHLDSAEGYRNEKSVGEAFKQSGLAREDVFITTKLEAKYKDASEVAGALKKSLDEFGLDYVDLLLIHAPWPWDEKGADYRKQNQEVWAEMEKFYKAGHARAIGISNFDIPNMQAILDVAEIKPQVNQVKWLIGNTKPAITKFAQDNDILIEAYSVLDIGKIMGRSDLQEIADHYNASIAQLSIRYALTKGVVPLTRSTNPEHILDNTKIDFEISAEDIAKLDAFTDPTKEEIF